eukprot:997430-Lingulodinium_polyedra.AAC.1
MLLIGPRTPASLAPALADGPLEPRPIHEEGRRIIPIGAEHAIAQRATPHPRLALELLHWGELPHHAAGG